MTIEYDNKEYELRIADEDDYPDTCSLCAFYDAKTKCPEIVERCSNVCPCSCMEANFRGYWKEIKK